MARKKSPERLIYTDLDGTLLDHETYSWKAAEPALKRAESAGIPVIFCTSKTRAEIELYRKQMRNRHPFISENGGAIYIPRGYFSREPPGSKRTGKYLVIELGVPYKKLREAIKVMQGKGLKVRGFGDMPASEVRELTGLSLRQAHLARKREYNEPFVLDNPKQEPKLLNAIQMLGFQYIRGGRFYHITGNNNKGLAVKILTGIYQQDADMPMVTAGLGDSPNDFTMLSAVHVPYLVKGHNSRQSRYPAFARTCGTGPDGWNSAVLGFIGEDF